jgi:gliding motility-associated-like protein
VTGYQPPAVDFSFSPDALDRKNIMLNCIIPAQTGVQYAWDMGDGSSESGSTIQHEYDISNTKLKYRITLTAKSLYNCIDSSFKFVDVVPFVPNVFTPNEDGINDVFMPGFDLEIIDRNGLQIHKGNSGWDGRYKGEPADPDTYFYLIFYKDSKQILHTRKGFVILVR